MVLGTEKAKEVVRQEGLAVYMITKEADGFKTWSSPQFNSFLVSEKIKKQGCGFFFAGTQARCMYACKRS
jgi:hypothetical protein